MIRTKLLITLVAGVVALTAVGCGGSGDGAGDGAGDAKKYLAMSFASGDVQIWNDTLDLMKPQVEEAGYGFLADNPQNDAQTQVSDWQAWIQRGDVAAIMGFPVQADALVPVTKQATDAGVTVISYASNWEGAVPGLTVDDYGDAETLGKDAGTWLSENLAGDDVTVAVLADRSTDLGSARADGMVAGVKATAPDAEIKELGIELSRQSAYDAAKAQIAADPDTTVWISMSDDPAKGAYQALLDSGVSKTDPGYFVGSLDATQESLQLVALADSIYRVAYIVTAQAIADLNVRLLLAAAEGDDVESESVVFDKVTTDNANEFLE